MESARAVAEDALAALEPHASRAALTRDRYAVYGDLRRRDSVILATVMHAKGLAFDFVEETPSLAWPLASRAGSESSPYLRTPEGFILSELHGMLDYLERAHPEPELLPRTPVRRVCARMLEAWLEFWLPNWPRRSWRSLEGVDAHLRAAGFLLGPRPTRPDWILAGWLESDVLIHEHARVQLDRAAPRLVSFGDDLLAAAETIAQGEARERGLASGAAAEDVLPISLLSLLEEIGSDYHAYLVQNHRALRDGGHAIELDLGVGLQSLPVQAAAEERRIEIVGELARLDRRRRRSVMEVLEPVGAWSALTLLPAIEPLDPADPRSL